MTASNVHIPLDREYSWDEGVGSHPVKQNSDELERIVPEIEQTFNRLRVKGINESEYQTIEGRLFVSRTVFNSKGDCSPSDNAWRFVKSISRKIGG